MIDINTYVKDQNALLDQAMTARLSCLWTALPGIVQSFDPVAMTCQVQPAIQGKVRSEDGTITLVNLPMLLDCPVVFPHGGGCSMTFPIKPGDECLVVFSSRAIDLWWQSGGVQPPVEMRMHDLSDGFVLVGAYSQPKVLQNVSTAAVQLRSDDGQAFFELNPETHNFTLTTPGNFSATVTDFTVDCQDFSVQCQSFSVQCSGCSISSETFDVTAGSSASITAPTIALNGQITGGGSGGATAMFTGNIEATGDVKAGPISLQGHVHSGVTTGGSDTGAAK